MAVLDGTLLKFGEYTKNVNISSDNDESPVQRFTHDEPRYGPNLHNGIALDSGEIIPDNKREIDGFKLRTYNDDVYNKIHVKPTLIDFGNVTEDKISQFEVWNAFFVEKNLNSIQISNPNGIEISPIDSPRVYNPNSFQVYTVQAFTDGPSEISSSVKLDWIEEGDRFVDIIGKRIVLFPYYFKAGMNESLSWNTEIITSRDGTEQRIRKRSYPRQSFTTEVFLSRDELSRAGNLVYGWRGKNWALPVWHESRVSSDVTIGDTVINVDTMYGDFRVGSLVLVWSSPRKFDVIDIVEISNTSITVERGINFNFSSPSIAPIRVGIMNGDPVKEHNGATGYMKSSFDVLDNIQIENSPLENQYNGLDVYLNEPILPASNSYVSPINVIDYGTGKTERYSHWNNPKVASSFVVPLDSLEDSWSFRMFLHRIAGRAIGFYMPSFENDLRPHGSAFAFSSIIIIDDDQDVQTSNRVNIAIKIKNGQWLFREINSIENNNNGTLTINIDSPININTDDIEFISYMGEKRLSSDSVSISWESNYVGQSNISLIEYEP